MAGGPYVWEAKQEGGMVKWPPGSVILPPASLLHTFLSGSMVSGTFK